MAATTMLHIRVDETLKTRSVDTLAAMGLSLSDAVRVFLTRVVAEQGLPFELKAPNAETRVAMAEADRIVNTMPRPLCWCRGAIRCPRSRNRPAQ